MSIQYPRWQLNTIREVLTTRRVLMLAGPRQCGKTTLAQAVSTEDALYRNLDDDALLASAIDDPVGFVTHEKQMLIIDEVQRAPALLRAIKLIVDKDQRPGRFLITGSANIESMPGANESLAGRVRKIRLRPLTLGERLNSMPSFIPKAFDQNFHSKEKPLRKKELIEIAFKGGFPEAIRSSRRECVRWYRDYAKQLIDRDLRDIINITRRDVMIQLLQVLGAWSSKLMDLTAIGSGLGVSRPTLETYINALEALFLIEKIQPWRKTDYDRVGKQFKIFMADSGLMSALLGWNIEEVELNPDKSGKLIETWVFNELSAQLEAQPLDYTLYHYRDRQQREIDFLIEREEGALLGIEIKAGSTASSDNFKHLRWFKENIAGDRPFVGIVLYSGSEVIPFGPDMWAVPYAALY